MNSTNRPLAAKLRPVWIVVSVTLLAGCATLSQDAGFGSVAAVAEQRLQKQVKWAKTAEVREAIQAQVQDLLGDTLTVDAAVQIALLNNAGLQATYSNLGIADADLVQAQRLHNPGFSFQRLEKNGLYEYERTFIFDLFGLLTIPARTAIEERRSEQTKLQVSAAVLRVAADTRRAYLLAVSAAQTARYMEDVKAAAEASAELAQRMARVGNWSRLDQARQQAFYADVAARLANAHQQSRSARERLTRLLGLWGTNIQFTLPDRLQDLPDSVREVENPESIAVAQRLDIQMARQELAGLAKSLGLTKATRFVNVLDVSYLNSSAAGEQDKTGYEVELQIPLFDWGDAKVAKAEALYMQAVERVAELAVNARSQARDAYSSYRTAFDVAKHYRDELVPLRRKISEENMLRYNGMLIGTFELLADARDQIASINSYIGVLRDFWLADAGFQMALTGTGGSISQISGDAGMMMSDAPRGH